MLGSSVRWLFVAGLVLAAFVAKAQTNNQLYVISNNLCLTLSSDQATVILSACGQYGYQQWDLSSGERLQLGGYCLDAFPGPSGALQIKPCTGALSQAWWFGQDGRITNKAQVQGCLSSTGTNGATFYLAQCGGQQASSFATSHTAPSFTSAPQLPPLASSSSSNSLPSFGTTYQQQLPMAGSGPNLPPLGGFSSGNAPPLQQQPPPVIPVQNNPLPPVQQAPVYNPPSLPQQQPQQQQQPETMSQQIQQQQQYQKQQQLPVDLGGDHYLCTCIVDVNAESCTDAVRAACTVGHLPSASCRNSFSKGNHDKIADDILKIIENGAKCASFDPATLKADAQRRPANLPKNAFRGTGEGIPTSEDHYLCACLDSKRSDRCVAAVKAACLVGHIPSGDCIASLNRNNHDGVTDHILRLIDSGAACSKSLNKNQLSTATDPTKKPGLFTRVTGIGRQKTITRDQKDLCTCLDDPESMLCGNAIKRACKEKRIPKEDCQVAENKHYMGGVTKHALKLIDHGAECPAHRSMTFTNHGCHCLQTWTEAGHTYTFPNNCADPGGKRGYAWCKTFSSEHCAGVEGSTSWDRCDNPKIPVRRDAEEVDGDGSTADGELGDEDHYLCICLSQTSTDEVCVAAVKAACSVGHLPQDACRTSFENDDHGAVSDTVVKLLEGGRRCMETLGSQDTYTPKPGETACPAGFYGFPNCKRKVECKHKCSHGSQCDYSDGTCQCLPNFVGPRCSHCAEGYSGRNCTPDGSGGGWTLGQGLIYLALFGGLVYAAHTAYKRFGGRGGPSTSLGVIYSKLPTSGGGQQPAEEENLSLGGGVELVSEADTVPIEADLGGDVEANISPPSKPKQVHTGLAV